MPSALATGVLQVAPLRPRTQAHTAATQFTHADLGASRFSRFRGAVARKPSLRDASLGSESPFIAFSVLGSPPFRLVHDCQRTCYH